MENQEVANFNDGGITQDQAAIIAKIVANGVEIYYDAMRDARKRILAGEDEFIAIRDELSKAKAAEMMEFDRVQRLVAGNQGDEKLLGILREMRGQSVRDWNVLNGRSISAQHALDEFLESNRSAGPTSLS